MKKPTKSALENMFHSALKELYYAEKKICKGLPKAISAARSGDLKNTLREHLGETKHHIKGLETIFDHLDKKPKAVRCEAIDSILAQVAQSIREFGKTNGADAALVYALQAAEHYEITRYGTLRMWADVLEWQDVQHILTHIRDQEWAADQKMTAMAVATLNLRAATLLE